MSLTRAHAQLARDHRHRVGVTCEPRGWHRPWLGSLSGDVKFSEFHPRWPPRFSLIKKRGEGETSAHQDTLSVWNLDEME